MRWTAVAAAIGLAGCGQPATLAVDDAWVRLPAVPGRPAAAYFTIHGGPAPATLMAVRTMGAARAELHESMANGMRPTGRVAVPASGTVAFAPNARHVMLFDVDPGIRPGGTMTLYLIFAGRSLAATAKVVGAADPAP